MRAKWVCCLVLLSQPLFGQGLTNDSDSNAGTAISNQPALNGADGTDIENVAAGELPVPYSDEQVAPLNYFGRGVGGRWRLPLYAAVDAVFLDRVSGNTDQPLVIDVDNNDTLLTTSNDYNYEPGVRATIGLTRPWCRFCSAWELTYLGVFDWDASAGVIGDNNLSLAGDLGFVVNGFTLAESIRTEYGSNLHSAEANCITCICRHRCCDCMRGLDWIVGVRYLKLDEDLRLLGNNEDVAAAVYDIDTDNNLYGAQFGARWRSYRRMRKFCGYWGWELIGKAGIFGNDASQRQYIVDEVQVNDFLHRQASASDDEIAAMSELGVSLLARLSDAWGMRFGYNLFWVQGVALASDQLDFSDTALSGAFIQRDGSVFLHGFNVGLEFGW